MGVVRVLVALALLGGTAAAWAGTVLGWGLTSMMREPVSIRQQSVARSRSSTPMFLYFGSSTRRHRGGGFHGGK
jgi:hypothetical protein